jgi:hypothetical protein
MGDTESLWHFSDRIDKTRRRALSEAKSFIAIAEAIVAEATVTNFDVCRGKEGNLKNCLRPQFTVQVRMETFDLFFNSPQGYRAQYLLDPDEGQKQNSTLIEKLSPKLFDFTKGKTTKHSMERYKIKVSLMCLSAKIWISEKGFNFDHNLLEEILVPEWLAHAKAARSAYANKQYPSPPEQEKAIWGVRAPTGREIELKGAFLDGEGNEVVPAIKVLRRLEIQKYGFA